MSKYIVIKKKNHILTLEASKVNLNRARLIATHPHDKYAKYLIAEIVETIEPQYKNENLEMQHKDETRESI